MLLRQCYWTCLPARLHHFDRRWKTLARHAYFRRSGYLAKNDPFIKVSLDQALEVTGLNCQFLGLEALSGVDGVCSVPLWL